jgi:poly-gamma-glutamate synthesis protein (capsule biosynthesis protein)
VGGDLRQRLARADGVIDEEGAPADKRFVFHASPEAIEALQVGHVDAVTLANNHMLDMGPDALVEELDRLDAARLAHTGAGRTVDEAWAPARLTIGGTELALLSVTDNRPAWVIERRQPGLAHAEIDPDGPGFTRLEREVRDLARQVDGVVVGTH